MNPNARKRLCRFLAITGAGSRYFLPGKPEGFPRITCSRKRSGMDILLLDSDQIRCYDTAGKPVPCEETGQDAAWPKRRSFSPERFQVRGQTVLDTLTGTVWSLNANPAEFPLTWQEAREAAAGMAGDKAYGYENWQLPSRRLLFSLLSHQYVNPVLPEGHPFANVFTGYYWTSDTVHRFPEQAWHIHLGGGRVARARKDDSALVWPVCPPLASPHGGDGRFQIRGERLVLDSLTGLIWSRDANPAGKTLSWQDALEKADALNRESYAGTAGWRVPNIRELESLVDLASDSPALAPHHPFKNVQEVYWSSSTSLYEPRYAWALYFRDGMVGVGFKPDTGFSLWPVLAAK